MILTAKKVMKRFSIGLSLFILLATSVLGAADGGDAGSAQTTGNQVLNRATAEYLAAAKSQGPAWLKTTDIHLTFTENYQPEYALETFQPLGKAGENGTLFFWQGRYANQNDHYAANLGLGWRKLAADQSRIIGVNLFYDYGFEYSLSRAGLGLEYLGKLAEHRLNCYIPISGDKLIGESETDGGLLSSYVRAVAGFDYELGTSLAGAPWLKLYASGFYYDYQYNPTETGYRLRAAMRLTPSFSTELGYFQSNLGNGGYYGKVLFQLAESPAPSLFFDGNRPKDGQKSDLSAKLLQKVERDNNIRTETFARSMPGSGPTGRDVTFTIYVMNTAIPPYASLPVEIWQDTPTGQQVYSGSADAGGRVTVNLADGPYFIVFLGSAVCNDGADHFTVDASHTQFTLYCPPI